jgi:menaquinone-dependent protoporphyrinogen oxidase
MKKILIAYASKHNSTAEIAHVIGEELRRSAFFQVGVQSIETVQDIMTYDAVVIGSAVYLGSWQPAAVDFLKQHEEALAQRPVWLFSSGPIGEDDTQTLVNRLKFPEALQSIIDHINPRDIAVFQGKLDPENLNFLERGAVKMVHAAIGDYRDWELIRGWAATIAHFETVS